MEGSKTGKGILENKEEKSVSLLRKKSQHEAELWRNFDKLIGSLVLLFEKQSECSFALSLIFIIAPA